MGRLSTVLAGLIGGIAGGALVVVVVTFGDGRSEDQPDANQAKAAADVRSHLECLERRMDALIQTMAERNACLDESQRAPASSSRPPARRESVARLRAPLNQVLQELTLTPDEADALADVYRDVQRS